MDANEDYERGDFGEPLNKAGKAVLDNEDPREEVVIERLAHAHCCEVCDQARAELQTLRDMVTQWHVTTNGMILAIENDVRMRLGMPPVDAGLFTKDDEEES